jgi:hypothetical protein
MAWVEAAFAVNDKPTVTNITNATKNKADATMPSKTTNVAMSSGNKNFTEPMDLAAFITIALGLSAFVLVIILLSNGSNGDLRGLNGGEIRKAIAIAFTMIYLIMLPCYFFYAYLPASVNASSVHNTTSDSSLQTFNVSSNAVPLLATSDFMSNFLYLYILIVSFYFGSRYFEDRRRDNNRFEMKKREVDSKMEILRKLPIDGTNKDKIVLDGFKVITKEIHDIYSEESQSKR